jgi:hypothetical protein
VTKTYHVPSVLVPRLIAHHGLTGEEGLNAFLSKRRDNRARWGVRIGPHGNIRVKSTHSDQ